jgi:hypothetical protein
MVEPVFISPFFVDYVLPFVLIFTLVFAILEKTKLLGEDKKQIDSIIGLIIGLILIAFPFARDVVVKLMPFLAVSVVILFVFMLLYGFVVGKKEGDVLGKPLKITLGIIVGLGLITAILFATGFWDPIYDFLFSREGGSQILINVLLIIIIAGAVISVVATKNKSSSSD